MIYPELDSANKSGAIFTRAFWDDDSGNCDNAPLTDAINRVRAKKFQDYLESLF